MIIPVMYCQCCLSPVKILIFLPGLHSLFKLGVLCILSKLALDSESFTTASFFQFGLLLWVLSYVGAWFNAVTLIIIGEYYYEETFGKQMPLFQFRSRHYSLQVELRGLTSCLVVCGSFLDFILLFSLPRLYEDHQVCPIKHLRGWGSCIFNYFRPCKVKLEDCFFQMILLCYS